MDNPLYPGSELSLRKIMMCIKVEDGERFTLTIVRDWNNVMEPQLKKKYKKHTVAVQSHLTAWSCNPHGHIVLTSFSAELQTTYLETKCNSDVPLDPEEV